MHALHRLQLRLAQWPRRCQKELTRPAECTYDQPSNRRRNPAPHYVEALESRLQKAEALLKAIDPDIDLDNAGVDPVVPQRGPLSVDHGVRVLQSSQTRPDILPAQSREGREGEKDSMLETMVDNTGSLDLDDQGYWDFHGHSSGLVFLRRMSEQFGDLMAKPEGFGLPFMRGQPLAESFDSPKSSNKSPSGFNLPYTNDLPPKDCAEKLCQNALDDACALMRFIHQPTFYKSFHRVYDMKPEDLGPEDNVFLPLLYVVIALGALFARAEKSQLQTYGYESAREQG